MSNITIIGTGNMARTIGALAVAGGNTVEVIGRDQSKAAELAKALGGSATAGEFGAVPAGDIVIVALGYANVVPVVAQYADALADKVIVDICNPVNAAADGLATPDGTSSAQEVAKAAPASATRGEGLQHHLRCCPGQGPTARRLLRRRRRKGQGGRGGVHRQPQAAPTRRRRLDHGALPGRNGPGHDRSRPTRGWELRLRPRRHRALEEGVSTFIIVVSDESEVLERFAAELIPAVREQVARQRA